jgi:hypothetical protein
MPPRQRPLQSGRCQRGGGRIRTLSNVIELFAGAMPIGGGADVEVGPHFLNHIRSDRLLGVLGNLAERSENLEMAFCHRTRDVCTIAILAMLAGELPF